MVWNVDYLLSELGIDYPSEKKGELCIPMTIKGVAPIDEATPEELAFCSSEGNDAALAISRSRAGVILCKKSVKQLQYHSQKKKEQQILIFLENPRLAAIRIIKMIHKEQKKDSIGISPRAIISKSAKIGKNCSVGDFSAIGDNCEIGDNTIIYDRVSILDNSNIGRNCIIQPGVVIGADGFAYERLHETLELERFPHIGGVKIGNNVEICSNCSIARGSLSDTIVGNGTKLDALVHVAHNVQIGKNCALTAGVIIGGSTIIGDTCWFGLNSTLKHKIKIGYKVIVGSGASVIDDIQDEDIVAGVPAKSIKHKVKSNQLFLMGGQSKHEKHKNITILKEQFKMDCLLIGSAVLMVPLLCS